MTALRAGQLGAHPSASEVPVGGASEANAGARSRAADPGALTNLMQAGAFVGVGVALEALVTRSAVFVAG